MEKRQYTEKDRELAMIKIDGKYHKIVASHHAMCRMEKRERNIDPYVVAGNIIALGPDRIRQLQEDNAEAIIIDEKKNVSIVIGFAKGDDITVITVIDKANVFVKKDTEICTL